MAVPSSIPGYFRIPLKLPHYILYPSVEEATDKAMIALQEYPGRVLILARDSQTGFNTILFSAACDKITGIWPDPLYLDIPQWIDNDDPNLFTLVAPDWVTDDDLQPILNPPPPAPPEPVEPETPPAGTTSPDSISLGGSNVRAEEVNTRRVDFRGQPIPGPWPDLNN